MSSRRKASLLILAAVFVIFSLTGIEARRVVRGQLVSRVDDNLFVNAQAARKAVELMPKATLSDLVTSFGPDRRPGLTYDSALVIVQDGKAVLSSPSGHSGHLDPLPDVTSLSDAQLRRRAGKPFTLDSVRGDRSYRTLVTVLPGHDGLLISATSLDGVDQTVHDLGTVLGISLVAMLVVIAVLVWLITWLTLKPIEDMIDTAAVIGAGDLSPRIADPPGHSHDTTRLAEALNAMLNRLEITFADKSASEDRLRRFVADASHELRTPLTTIRGYTDLYRTGIATSPADVERAVGRIHGEATRMADLVDDLLLLARLDQDRPLADEPVDLVQLGRDAVADAAAVEPDRPIAFDDPAGETLVVRGDEAHLRQAIANLLANVRRHTPGDAAVTVAIHRVDHEAHIVVADTGPGLAPEDAALVFDRFYRAEPSRTRATGGAGLGLSIVASVAEAHGGRVDLTSTPGHGATFTIALPIEPPTADESI